MKLMHKFVLLICLLCISPWCSSETTVRVRDTGGPSIAEAQSAAYNGPQARVAVSRFENKSHDARNWWNPQIGDGMADMLTTALFNTGRFIVLERQSLGDVLDEQDLGASGRVRQDTAAAIGEIEGAEILIVAAVTEFEDNAGGTRGGLGGFGGRVLGAIAGGVKKAHMAIDLRLIDARTSRVLAATSVEGEAKDFNVGGALGGYTGSVGLGGALQTWENTPKEKALRAVIEGAVDFVVSRTPANYYHGPGGSSGSSQATSSSTTSNSATSAPSSGSSGNEQIVITVNSAAAHQGPNDKTSVQFSLPAGTITDAKLRVKGWIQVSDGSGKVGWIKDSQAVSVE